MPILILYPHRGRIGIKRQNPIKPAKYGILHRGLLDAKVPCTYYSLPMLSLSLCWSSL